ncbi:MAG: hypothetical protein HY235_00395 [Acidobacteria bacterium]|nr:hypothetical protein [Acidobacteriota bacterium]
MAELETATREQIAQVLADRFASAREAFQKEIAAGELALSERFNQMARRLRLAENSAEWKAIVLEIASLFAAKAALFDATDTAIVEAPAFATAVESKDTIVTVRAASELSAQVLETLGESSSGRCYLFPILEDGNVTAILYAEPGEQPLDRNALELVATLAATSVPKPSPAPEDALRLQARRFARVRAAEMRLYDSPAVLEGRKHRNLYIILRAKIDSGRQEFRNLYLRNCPSMADYFHEELVRTLANGDAEAMGAEYPGPMA